MAARAERQYRSRAARQRTQPFGWSSWQAASEGPTRAERRARSRAAREQAQPFGWPSWQAAGEAPTRKARRREERARRQARQVRPTPREMRAAAQPAAASAGTGSGVVAEARRWIGTNPTGRRSLWCGRFMNFVLERTGHHGTGSDMARSFVAYGQRVSGPQVGAIAVMSRGRRGGHVGVVSGIDASGNPIVISGNHGNRVAEAVYPRGRIFAYVLPEG
jgi:uncharacterized protein (TIGR02594 family)